LRYHRAEVADTYENRRERLLTRAQFARRVVNHLAFSLGAIAVSLGVGVLGYHNIAHFTWIDSLLDASMILGGMGPVGHLESDAAKVFASIYALFSGIIFIGVLGMLLAPFVHRIMHKLHMEEDKKGK
jgi:hypothetical protein